MGGLTLSSGDVSRFVVLQEALLSPLEYATIKDWCVAVLRVTEALFRSDRSAIFIPSGERVHYVSESIDHRSLEAFQSGIGEMQPGALRFTESLVDQAWEVRRKRGIEVWSIPMLERLTGIPMERVPMYHDAVKPAGLVHSAVATTPVPDGEAFLGVSHSRPADDPFGEARLQLMGMLVPAFKAGVHMLVRLDSERVALARTLDELGQALVVWDAKGHELHRTRGFQELLARDPERERVFSEVRLLAGSLLQVRVPRIDAPPAPTGTREVETSVARYRIRGTYVGAGILGIEGQVLVAFERLTPELPGPQDLIDHHSLTRREAEVALLLARGLSNREIATRLSVSPFTVRHHAEWVFAKLGLHSRKALALRLMADRT